MFLQIYSTSAQSNDANKCFRKKLLGNNDKILDNEFIPKEGLHVRLMLGALLIFPKKHYYHMGPDKNADKLGFSGPSLFNQLNYLF